MVRFFKTSLLVAMAAAIAFCVPFFAGDPLLQNVLEVSAGLTLCLTAI